MSYPQNEVDSVTLRSGRILFFKKSAREWFDADGKQWLVLKTDGYLRGVEK